MFIGQVTHQIDEKGRIRIPARFKDDLGAHPFITCGTNGCLFVYSGSEAQRVLSEKFGDGDFSNADVAKAQRMLFARAIIADEDKQGRILLPSHLLKHANITKNVVTIGAFNRVEIWSEENWLAYSEGADFDGAVSLICEDKKSQDKK